ncbi:MAG: sensor histidine kinase [Planctomycetales bacterium]|jgi:signal transduction histidine kinase
MHRDSAFPRWGIVFLSGCVIAAGSAALEYVFLISIDGWLAAILATTLATAIVIAATSPSRNAVVRPQPNVEADELDGSTQYSAESSDSLEAAALSPDSQTVLAEIESSVEPIRPQSQARTDFIANMSHELRTPLNSIIGFAEVLQEPVFGELTDDQQSYVTDILDSGRHLLSLINDILDLSKIESGKMELNAGQVDLPHLVERSIRMFREQALRENVSLNYEPSEELPLIEADERKLKQVLFNLLSNALKFTADGGRIEISTERCDEHARLVVCDSGCGISQDQLDRVFESYFQINSELTREVAGTGLGLPLVRKIAELHGGRAWCESELGKGSHFIIELPIEQARNEAPRVDETVTDEVARDLALV